MRKSRSSRAVAAMCGVLLLLASVAVYFGSMAAAVPQPPVPSERFQLRLVGYSDYSSVETVSIPNQIHVPVHTTGDRALETLDEAVQQAIADASAGLTDVHWEYFDTQYMEQPIWISNDLLGLMEWRYDVTTEPADAEAITYPDPSIAEAGWEHQLAGVTNKVQSSSFTVKPYLYLTDTARDDPFYGLGSAIYFLTDSYGLPYDINEFARYAEPASETGGVDVNVEVSLPYLEATSVPMSDVNITGNSSTIGMPANSVFLYGPSNPGDPEYPNFKNYGDAGSSNLSWRYTSDAINGDYVSDDPASNWNWRYTSGSGIPATAYVIGISASRTTPLWGIEIEDIYVPASQAISLEFKLNLSNLVDNSAPIVSFTVRENTYQVVPPPELDEHGNAKETFPAAKVERPSSPTELPTYHLNSKTGPKDIVIDILADDSSNGPSSGIVKGKVNQDTGAITGSWWSLSGPEGTEKFAIDDDDLIDIGASEPSISSVKCFLETTFVAAEKLATLNARYTVRVHIQDNNNRYFEKDLMYIERHDFRVAVDMKLISGDEQLKNKDTTDEAYYFNDLQVTATLRDVYDTVALPNVDNIKRILSTRYGGKIELSIYDVSDYQITGAKYTFKFNSSDYNVGQVKTMLRETLTNEMYSVRPSSMSPFWEIDMGPASEAVDLSGQANSYLLIVDTDVPSQPSMTTEIGGDTLPLTNLPWRDEEPDAHRPLNDFQVNFFTSDSASTTISSSDTGPAGIWRIEYFKLAVGEYTPYDVQHNYGTYGSNRVQTVEVGSELVQDDADSSKWAFTDAAASESDYFVYVARSLDKAGNARYAVSEPIIIDPDEPSIVLNDPDGSMPEQQSGIFTSSVSFNVEVSDLKDSASLDSGGNPVKVSSGLNPNLMWRLVKEDVELDSGTVVLNKSDDLTGQPIEIPQTGSWSDILANSTGYATINISKDYFQYNNMVLMVTVADNAGNEPADWLSSDLFSIDSTGPVVEVSYDNNDVLNGTYFKADRVQTIRVTDNNFDESLIRIGATPYGGWLLAAQSGDSETWVRSIAYATDGNYEPKVLGTDLAGNERSIAFAEGTAAPEAFTVDKTVPVVSVSYDVGGAANGRYFATPRNASIVISEHNFTEAGVTVLGTASMGGNSTALQPPASWRSEGDNHTAGMSFTADADYTFTISVTDLAGNVSAEYPQDSFTVDTTAPMVSIFGVEDMSANNDYVAPTISYMDTNFDPSLTSYTLTGVHRGEVGHAVSVADTADGRTVNLADFERVKAEDDLYTLTATIRDLAGNSASDQVSFSVNRFGSVYVVDDSVLPILGRYSREERDIIFREINVDSLEPQSIKVTSSWNGQTSVISADNYSMRRTSEPGDWAVYEYTVPKENFSSDGSYQLSVYSEDRAGNVNENTAPEKAVELNFAIDKTPPVIIVTGVEPGGSYDANARPVDVSVKDNIRLESVEVSVNGELASYTASGETYAFEIPAADAPQDIAITATDSAGNTALYTMDNIVVTTNPVLRWYYNTPLFIGTIAGLAVLLAGGLLLWWWLFFFKRRKREEEEEEPKAAARA